MRRHPSTRLLAAVLLLVLASPASAAPPQISSEGAVLWDPADERVLEGKRPRRPRLPASTTKIMTVLLALEHAGTEGLDDLVTVSAEAVRVGARPGAANLGLDEGQRVPLRHLLAALMLRSGNDAAVAVAEHVAGSEAAFVDRMNARAAELGLSDTSFVNASGLTDDPSHRASPLDLARLAAVAMRHDAFARWAGARTLDVPGFGLLENRNELLGSYRGATGVKTGYTLAAGMTLVASARRGRRELYAVVLGSDDSFGEAAALLDHGFQAFRRVEPLAAGQRVARYRWPDGDVAVAAGGNLGRTLRRRQQARYRLVLEPDVPRPVRAGQSLGRAELVVRGDVVDSVPLLAGDAVGPPTPPDTGAQAAGQAVEQALRSFSRLLPLAAVAPGSGAGGADTP